jgi:hypothetical protein
MASSELIELSKLKYYAPLKVDANEYSIMKDIAMFMFNDSEEKDDIIAYNITQLLLEKEKNLKLIIDEKAMRIAFVLARNFDLMKDDGKSLEYLQKVVTYVYDKSGNTNTDTLNKQLYEQFVFVYGEDNVSILAQVMSDIRKTQILNACSSGSKACPVIPSPLPIQVGEGKKRKQKQSSK